MWDGEDWRSRAVQVPREMNDEADDLQVQLPIDHCRRCRLQHRSRFRELFGTTLHRIARTRRHSHWNSRDSVLPKKDVISIFDIDYESLSTCKVKLSKLVAQTLIYKCAKTQIQYYFNYINGSNWLETRERTSSVILERLILGLDMDPAGVKLRRAVQIVLMRWLVILRQAVILGGLVVSWIMRRSHVTFRGVRVDPQVVLVISCATEIAPTAQTTTPTLEMLRYVMIAVVRYINSILHKLLTFPSKIYAFKNFCFDEISHNSD